MAHADIGGVRGDLGCRRNKYRGMAMSIRKILSSATMAAVAAGAVVLFPVAESQALPLTNGCELSQSSESFAAVAVGTPPSLTGNAGGCFNFGASLDGKFASFGSDLTFETPAGLITISGSGNIDPNISFSIGVTDTGAPSEFAFLFTIPIVPLTGLATVHAELGVTLTDSASDDPGSISITPGPTFATLIMSNNVGACAAGVDVGTAVSQVPPPFTTTTNFVADGFFNPSPGCDSSISVLIDFTGSGNGDNYGLTGIFLISEVPVPEPTTLALLGVGLVGLAGTVRRRKS